MAEWRARGYVADSDEEDDSQGSDSSNAGYPTTSAKLPNNHGGLQVAQEVSEALSGDVPVLQGGRSQTWLAENKEQFAVGSCTNIGAGRVETNDEPRALESNDNKESPSPKRDIRQKGPISSAKETVPGADDIEEQQQDHCTLPPSSLTQAKPYSEALCSTEDGKGASTVISTPIGSHILLPSSAAVQANPALPERSEGQGRLSRDVSQGHQDAATSRHESPQPHRTVNVVVECSRLAEPNQSARGGRSLRHRNPIQLHPYAIESEKYRQVLKARGLKPLRIAQTQDGSQIDTADSQMLDVDAIRECREEDIGQRSQNPPTASSSPLFKPSSSPEPLGDLPGNLEGVGGEEFPDVDTLLRAHPEGVVQNGFKRRRTAHTFSKKSLKAPLDSEPSPRAEYRAPPPGAENSTLLDVPASPPPSSESHGSNVQSRIPRFKVPRGLSPVALPTPLASSEPRIRPFIDIFEDEGSLNGDQSPLGDQDNEIYTPSDDSSLEERPTDEVRQVQRRIRGVLPASWLKLDLKTQTKPSKNGPTHQRILSSGTDGLQRGVARRRSKQKSLSPSTSRAVPIVVSDDENSSPQHDGVDDLAGLYRTSERSRDSALQDWLEDDHSPNIFAGEVEEDNRIDQMLPAGRRRSTGNSKGKSKANVRLKDRTSSGRVSRGTSKSLHRGIGYQPRITNQLSKKRIKRSSQRTPKLGILDSPALALQPEFSMPQFLRIALRTARSRSDQGRQSPSKKQLRFATVKDTKEVEQTLDDWRKGRIQPRSAARSQPFRIPFADRIGNNETLPRQGTDTVRTYKATKSSGYTPHASSTRPRKLQQTLDKIIARSAMTQGHRPRIRKFKFATIDATRDLHKKPGHIIPSIGYSSNIRPAMLEGLHDDYCTAFQQSLCKITKLHQPNPRQETRPNRKRVPHRLPPGDGNNRFISNESNHKKKMMQVQGLQVTRQEHDLMARRVTNVLELPLMNDTKAKDIAHAHNILAGLDRIDEDFTVSDVEPLPVGTQLDKATFIGSGDFYECIRPENFRAMDEARGFQKINVRRETFALGPWNETLASRFETCFDVIHQGIQDLATSSPSAVHSLEDAASVAHSVVHYFSYHLSFVDPGDRVAFLHYGTSLLNGVVDELARVPRRSYSPSGKHEDLQILLGIYANVMIHQLYQVAQHEFVPSSMKGETSQLLATSIKQNLRTVLHDRYIAIQLHLNRLSLEETHGTSGLIIQDDYQPVQALVASHHILYRSHGSLEPFWGIVNAALPEVRQPTQPDARSLEQYWYYTLSLLPFLELDVYGKLEPYRRSKVSCENWKFVKPLIDTVFTAYNAHPANQSPSFNSYCRKIYARCFYLIKEWHWTSCKSTLGTLFDFFAQNELAHLDNEANRGNHGSPTFLERLDENPSLELKYGDRCFHVLLKIIGVVLTRLRNSTDLRSAQNLVFRILPNHGRYLPKESDIDRGDFDALRNHHDLLCTLYWASPPQYRPRLSSLCDLVDMRSSHLQACQLNIRAWSRLVKFQLSTQEPLGSLKPFTDWHSNILECTLAQHENARIYGESKAHIAGYGGLDRFNRLEITPEVLQHESLIFHNEFEVEALVVNALTALQMAIQRAPDNESASKLVNDSLILALRHGDLSLRRRNNVVLKTLDVVRALLQRSKAGSGDSRLQRSNDESQDFGDWSAFEDDDVLDGSVLRMLEGPLRTLLSNCFGADIVPKDELLSKIVDCYTSLASVLVHQGHRSWDDYLNPFGQCSWELLSGTPQSQQYHPYYLAKLLELNEGIYVTYKEHFVKSWLIAIVEQEVFIRFQHTLTSSILNAGSEDLLLYNPPFCIDNGSGRFSIAPDEFLQGRLSLIYMLLSNMWEAVNQVPLHDHGKLNVAKQQFKEWLRAMMGAMKRNYQELGQGSRRGAYVEFVQAIIQALHKNTSTICPVDKFFTNPTEFPLPASDPAYIVGQLQNYGLRLGDPRTPKQLAAFLQSLSEQAVKGSQQADLADTLHTAMSDTFELGDTTNPTLRSFLVKAIVPAYLIVGFGIPGGFVFLVPFLKALQMAFRTLFTGFSANNRGSVASVVFILSSFLQDLWLAWPVSQEDTDCLTRRHILHVLRECYITVTTLFPVLDYIRRLHGSLEHVMELIGFLKVFAVWSLEQAEDYQHVLDLRQDTASAVDPALVSVRTFAQKELERSVQAFWFPQTSMERGRLPRAQARRELSDPSMGLGSYQEETSCYKDAAQGFLDCLETFLSFGTEGNEIIRPRKGLDLHEVMI